MLLFCTSTNLAVLEGICASFTGKEEGVGAAADDEGPFKERAFNRERSAECVEGNRGCQERRTGRCISQSEHCSLAQQ